VKPVSRRPPPAGSGVPVRTTLEIFLIGLVIVGAPGLLAGIAIGSRRRTFGDTVADVMPLCVSCGLLAALAGTGCVALIGDLTRDQIALLLAIGTGMNILMALVGSAGALRRAP
jgi:hypothetical protein